MAELTKVGDIRSDLEALDILLADEKRCLVELRHDKLLEIVNRRQVLIERLTRALSRASLDKYTSGADPSVSIAGKLRVIREKGRANRRLAKASLVVIGKMQNLLLRARSMGREYDRTGCERRSTLPVTFEESA